jgi:hypothetical protein
VGTLSGEDMIDLLGMFQNKFKKSHEAKSKKLEQEHENALISKIETVWVQMI